MSKKEVTKILFSQYARTWFYGEYAQRITPTRVKKSHYYLDKHILPYFNYKFLHEITATDTTGFYKQSQGKYSHNTIHGIFSFLSILFRVAVEKGILDEHPMKGMMKMMKIPKQTFVPWSNEEVSNFLKAAKDAGDGVMYEFELSTGLRLGELLALSWGDIDFVKQTVTIKRNVSSFGNRKAQIDQIRSGFRTIVLTSDLLAKLKEHKEKQHLLKEQIGERYHQDLNLVFPKNDGRIQNPSTVRTKFYHIIDKANVSRITFHDLRKMHAHLLIQAGVPLYLVKERLGYNSIETIRYLVPQNEI